MAQQLSIEINPINSPCEEQTAEFVPSPKTVMVNDLVFWRNNDTKAAHQPMPVDAEEPDVWVTTPIPPAVDSPLGGGAATSNTFSYGPSGTTLEGILYTCAFHQDEKGTLIVLNNATITNNAGAPVGTAIAVLPDPTFNVDEAFVFINTDSNPHWPAPSLDPQHQNDWMSQAIQPGDLSPPIAICTATDPPGTEDPKGMTYYCVLHQATGEEESGTLVVMDSE